MTDLSPEALDRLVTLARDSVVQQFKTSDGRLFVALPGVSGVTLQDITPPGWEPDLPQSIKAAPKFDTRDSFVAFIRDYSRAHTRIFAHLDENGGGSIRAHFDYHAADAPDRNQFGATYALQSSEEWKRWSGISGKLMPQAQFVRFLEENAADIEAPSGADILELAQDFSTARKVDFRSAVRMQSGDYSFEYSQETTAKAKSDAITVPSKFQLRIPVFFGEPTTEVWAHLRWSIDEGALKLGVELHRPLYIRQAVFAQIVGLISDGTGLPVLYGLG